MKVVPFEQFCGPTYLATSSFFNAESAVNLYPEPGNPTARTKMMLVGRPGLSGPFITLATSPARALWAGTNRLFAVGGTHFYEVSNTGTVITDYGAMAGSSGNGACTILANGTQLLVYDSGAAAIYNANTVGPAMTKVFNATALEYLDGYYIAIATGASLSGTNPNQINVSNFLDGTTWNALNFVLRTGAADLPNGLAALNGLLWIFGQKTIEVWYNAGNPLFPFARVQGGDIGLGLLAPASVVKFYNTLLWLGADDRGYAQVYMAQGLNPVRVSNFAIEQLLNSGGSLKLVNAWARGYQEQGHTFYCLTLVDNSNVPYGEFVYDLTTGLWHERRYFGAWPISFASVPGFLNGVTNFVGDIGSGSIYQQAITIAGDAGTSVSYERVAPYLSDRDEWVKYPYFELIGEMGSAAPFLSYSNDGGVTFGENFNMKQNPDKGTPAAVPTFRRYWARQLGRSRARVFQVTVGSSTDLVRWAGANVGVGDGNS